MEGRYHGNDYKATAEAFGLLVERNSMGWGQTSLDRGTRTRYAAEITALDKVMAVWNPFVARKGGRGQAKYACECPEPRIIRVHAGIAGRDGIRCEVCGQLFQPAES